MAYSKSIDYPSCPLVRGRDAPCIGHQSITGYSILWNCIFSSGAWMSSAWNGDTDLSEPISRTPCSEYKYHFCFKWTKAHHPALNRTNRRLPSDLKMGPLRITQWEMFDFVLLILPTAGMWSVSSLCTHTVWTSLFPHSLICSTSYRYTDSEWKIQRETLMLEVLARYQTHGSHFDVWKCACLAEILVMELTSV